MNDLESLRRRIRDTRREQAKVVATADALWAAASTVLVDIERVAHGGLEQTDFDRQLVETLAGAALQQVKLLQLQTTLANAEAKAAGIIGARSN